MQISRYIFIGKGTLKTIEVLLRIYYFTFPAIEIKNNYENKNDNKNKPNMASYFLKT